MTHRAVPAMQPATRADEDAVAHLFEELHTQNAALDERFALAPGWRAVLHRPLPAPGTHPARVGGWPIG